jgi:hypothetical protein
MIKGHGQGQAFRPPQLPYFHLACQDIELGIVGRCRLIGAARVDGVGHRQRFVPQGTRSQNGGALAKHLPIRPADGLAVAQIRERPAEHDPASGVQFDRAREIRHARLQFAGDTPLHVALEQQPQREIGDQERAADGQGCEKQHTKAQGLPI